MPDVIRRYIPNSNSKFLEDTGEIADPDFWRNEENDQAIPIWSVCGPIVRESLDEGNRIFFTPRKTEMPSDYEYICTGILTVESKLSIGDFLSSPKINKQFKKDYLDDLIAPPHLLGDIEDENHDTVKKRVDNIIIGDPEQSIWFGENDTKISEVLRENDFGAYADSVENANRQPKHLEIDEAGDLLNEKLRNNLSPINGSPGYNESTQKRC